MMKVMMAPAASGAIFSALTMAQAARQPDAVNPAIEPIRA